MYEKNIRWFKFFGLICILAMFLFFFVTPALASEWHVAKNGTDQNPGTETAPFLTISNGVKKLQPGDTLYIHEGVYDEEIYNLIPSGTEESPIIIKAYPGDSVTIQPSKGYCGGKACRVVTLSNVGYINFYDISLDASNVLYDAAKLDCKFDSQSQIIPGTCAHHITFRGGEIMNSYTNCFYVAKESEHNEFINLKVHTCGIRHPDYPSGHRLFYITGSYNLVEGVEGYDAGAGIGAWVVQGNPSYNIFRNNIVHDIGTNPVLTGNKNPGIDIYRGEGNIVYNNIVYNSAGGIRADYESKNGKILNNTVYNSNNPTSLLSGIAVGKTAVGTIIKNNIVIGTGQQLNILNTSTILSNNLTTDPKFIDASKNDFRLMADSPAIDAGEDTSSFGVTKDRNNTKRPQGLAYDLGAFELPVAISRPTLPVIRDFSASSVSIEKGQSVALSWTVEGADWVNLDDEGVASSGSEIFYPTTTKVYKLEASKKGLRVNKTVKVEVSDSGSSSSSTSHSTSRKSQPKSTPLPAPSPLPTPSPQSKYNFGITLIKRGVKGEDCKSWQMFLNEHLNESLVVDAWCGKMTMAAAAKWQASVGLVPDGILGPKSRAKAMLFP